MKPSLLRATPALLVFFAMRRARLKTLPSDSVQHVKLYRHR